MYKAEYCTCDWNDCVIVMRGHLHVQALFLSFDSWVFISSDCQVVTMLFLTIHLDSVSTCLFAFLSGMSAHLIAWMDLWVHVGIKAELTASPAVVQQRPLYMHIREVQGK